MKVNLDKEITDLKGKPIQVSEVDKSAITVKYVVTAALLGELEGEPREGKASFDRYQLAEKINNAEADIDLAVEDVALIKDRIGKMYPPIIVGPLWKILN